MTTEQFTYWLQGFAEISTKAPTEEQWIIIKDHLQLVFKKETLNRTTKEIKIESPLKNWDVVKRDPYSPPYTTTCNAENKLLR